MIYLLCERLSGSPAIFALISFVLKPFYNLPYSQLPHFVTELETSGWKAFAAEKNWWFLDIYNAYESGLAR